MKTIMAKLSILVLACMSIGTELTCASLCLTGEGETKEQLQDVEDQDVS
jgi:hypothetical protein